MEEYGKSKSFNDVTAYGAMDASHLPIYKAMLEQRKTGNYTAAGQARDGYNLFEQGDGANAQDYMSIFMKEAGKMYGLTKALGEMIGENAYGTQHCPTCSCGNDSELSPGKEGHGIQYFGSKGKSTGKSGLESRLGKHYKN